SSSCPSSWVHGLYSFSWYGSVGAGQRGYRLRLIPVIDESSSAPACPAWCLARHGFDAELVKKAVAAGADGRAVGHEAIIHQHYENVHY
ncbi:hypothetical protein, partial [Xanthomonas campestris]|uniref:hypothetical protein n=1 Tax=Xanthomonas campestris TaxID=339 RepID=UPI003D6DDDED